jgi:hypothetical protein
MLRVYWWRPFRTARSAAIELTHNKSAWATLAFQSRRFPSNFGDEFNRDLFSSLAMRGVRWDGLQRAEFIGVGSLLNAYNRSSADASIFGAGMREPFTFDARPGSIIALRGRHTRERTAYERSVALGDPGLLANQVYRHSPTARSGRLLIPHFTDLNSAKNRSTLSRLQGHGFRIAWPSTSPSRMARLISSASVVASSALHGIVFSHSYGTPCIPFRFPQAAESTFKYDDYFSALDLSYQPYRVDELLDTTDRTLAAMAHLAPERRVRSIRDNLVNAWAENPRQPRRDHDR